LMAITRNPGFQFYIPTENEWYKAAYYDPNKSGPGVGGYWFYPTKHDAANSPINLLSAIGTNNANFYENGYTLPGPQHITDVGSFASSPSAYGTFDQGGNVFEWNEAIVQGSRGWRGGSWFHGEWYLSAADRNFADYVTYESDTIGFRITIVPEPSTFVLLGIGALSLLIAWRRKRAK
jgi:formylglycine-generating enzyme